MNLLIVTGAGGAGVTTLAAAAAHAAARTGSRTLLLSQEPAPLLHLLFGQADGSPAFRVPVPDEAGGLWCKTATPERETAATWQTLQPWMAEAAESLGGEPPEPALLAMLPDSRLLALLLALNQEAADETFDTIVLDPGPAEPLARWLLVLAAATHLNLSGSSDPNEHLAVRIGRPLLRRITGVPLPDDASRRALGRLAARLTEGAAALTAGNAGCIAVTRPGRLGAITLRPALSLLALAGVPLSAIFTRQVQTGAGPDPMNTDDAPLPHHHFPEASAEPIGTNQLAALADATFPTTPARYIQQALRPRVVPGADDQELRLPLPFVAPSRMRLLQDGNRLTLIIPDGRRTLPLPDALAGRACAGARMENGFLSLVFPSGASD